MIIYKQQFLHSDWLNPKSVEFHQLQAKPHSISFFITISKITKKSLPRFVDNWKHRLGLASARAALCKWPLVHVRFQNLLKNPSTYRNNTKKKNVWKKSNDAYSLSIRAQTAINHISIFTFLCFFLRQYQRPEIVFFQSASWKRHCATHWRQRRGWDLVIFNWFVLSMRMQVILDSSFARPGSTPI